MHVFDCFTVFTINPLPWLGYWAILVIKAYSLSHLWRLTSPNALIICSPAQSARDVVVECSAWNSVIDDSIPGIRVRITFFLFFFHAPHVNQSVANEWARIGPFLIGVRSKTESSHVASLLWYRRESGYPVFNHATKKYKYPLISTSVSHCFLSLGCVDMICMLPKYCYKRTYTAQLYVFYCS